MNPNLEIKGLEFKDFNSLDTKEKGCFDGILVGFDNVDHGKDIITKGAMSRTLAEWSGKGQLPPVQWNHDDNDPVGMHLEAKPDGYGLYVKGKVMIDREHVTEGIVKAYNTMTSNGPKGMSVGFLRSTMKASKDKNGNRVISDLDWVEGSILPYGMNDRAVILSAKSLFAADDGTPFDIRQMEQILRDGGLSIKQAKAFLAQGYRGLQRDVESLVYDEASMRAIKESADRLNQMMADYNLTTKEA